MLLFLGGLILLIIALNIHSSITKGNNKKREEETYVEKEKELDEESRKRDVEMIEKIRIDTIDRKNTAGLIISNNQETIDKFLLIAEHKVYTIDEYGDEQKDEEVLKRELDYVLKKISDKEELTNSNFDATVKYLLKNHILQCLKTFHSSQSKGRALNPDIARMSGSEFEIYILRLLENKGYLVTHSGQTGDQGADLIMERDGRKIIIQAKHYSGSVGNGAVQEVISAIRYYNGDEGWVITNSRFTKSAEVLAQKANITLIDGNLLGRMDEFFQ